MCHHQWQRDTGDAAPLDSTTSHTHHHETGAAAAAVTPKEHVAPHHEPGAVAAKEPVTPAAAERTSSTTAAPSTTIDAPPANAERTASLNKADSHRDASPAPTSTTDAAAPDAAAAKPDDGEYHGEHAGKLGYGPQAPSGGGLPDRLKAMEEKIKGKLTHNPELVQQAHERDTGELAEKRRQYDASHDDGAFNKPAEDDEPKPAAAATTKEGKAEDVRESGHAASADAATAGTKSA
ncbi:uncharacterized protein RHOBADRAFT_56424 [Rhodotorula graminis WP1]|uniref:Proteophosphoglycan ppg4 n=1 Tax=Rhodotorula graminis (strain WP1) TaxID=578459 RepID=A0A0P9EEJ9_RHOGW|nr:uncharacterized protein RHOBADRAFT_56424 [Rhodotorula graminis WP1]KPV71809.1 hypothetical protein RHOBADRAFT_56424 [Rhodotorula graminis WP1]